MRKGLLSKLFCSRSWTVILHGSPSSPFAFSVEETFTIKLSFVASSRLTAPFATSRKKFSAGKTNRKYAQRPAAWVFSYLRGGNLLLRSFSRHFLRLQKYRQRISINKLWAINMSSFYFLLIMFRINPYMYIAINNFEQLHGKF